LSDEKNENDHSGASDAAGETNQNSASERPSENDKIRAHRKS